MTTSIKDLVEKLRSAMLVGGMTVPDLQNKLMGVVATALKDHDKARLLELRGWVSTLIPVAGRYGDGSASTRWRTVWELLDAFYNTPLKQAQERLINDPLVASHVQALYATPGMTVSDLCQTLNTDPSTVDDVTRRLHFEGLLTYIGVEFDIAETNFLNLQQSRFFLTEPGKTAWEQRK